MESVNRRRVLVVDDNPFNLQMISCLLTKEGFSVMEADNGNKALELMGKIEFSLIYMDLLMPGMDGFETIRRIRSLGIETPIIIMSSMDNRADRRRGLEAGGNAFLAKPVDILLFRKLLNSLRGEGASSGVYASRGPKEEVKPRGHVAGYGILLIEEDDALSTRYGNLLSGFGFNVTRALNGALGWEIFCKNPHRYKIVISNIFTPGIDGLGILARIKNDYPLVPVFIYAPKHDAKAFQLAIQLGAGGVITLPEFENAIFDMILSALKRTDLEDIGGTAPYIISQVRRAQKELIRFGCMESCRDIDIAFSPLSEAGGDIAGCRRFNAEGRCGIFLGDVAGHNVISSYISAISLGILSSNWSQNQNPEDLLKKVNKELNNSEYDEFHLCASALLWDRRREKISFATAGNPGGLIRGKEESKGCRFRELGGGGLCLGLLEDESLFYNDEFRFFPGEWLFLFSDGIKMEEVREAISSGRIEPDKESVRGLGRRILDDILMRRKQKDDVILIVLRAPEKREDGVMRFEMAATYDEVDRACSWGMELMDKRGVPKGKDPVLLNLALREALTNAVKHGNSLDREKFVDISFHFNPGELIMDVSDQGIGFELPESGLDMDSLEPFQINGRGLAVMNCLSDEIKIMGSTVRLRFKEEKP